jgi:hypothetical protein
MTWAGKRMALQNLRITTALIVLNLEMLALPEDLASMDGYTKTFRFCKVNYLKLKRR